MLRDMCLQVGTFLLDLLKQLLQRELCNRRLLQSGKLSVLVNETVHLSYQAIPHVDGMPYSIQESNT